MEGKADGELCPGSGAKIYFLPDSARGLGDSMCPHSWLCMDTTTTPTTTLHKTCRKYDGKGVALVERTESRGLQLSGSKAKNSRAKQAMSEPSESLHPSIVLQIGAPSHSFLNFAPGLTKPNYTASDQI